MQKFHTILAWLLLLFLLAHLIMGVVTMLSPVSLLQGPLPWAFLALVLVHAVMALWKVSKKKKLSHLVAYPKQNGLYWARILSGIAVFVLVFVHRTLWTVQTPFGKLLRDFEWPSLLAQLLFVAALAVHILLNLRPLLIDSGIDPEGAAKKWLKVIAVLLLLVAAVAALIYFMRGAL